MKYKTKLSIMDLGTAKGQQQLKTGDRVPDSGIYRVSHARHNLPNEVSLLKDRTFPRCSRCGDPVFYELVRSAPGIAGHSSFAVALYELPELAKDDIA